MNTLLRTGLVALCGALTLTLAPVASAQSDNPFAAAKPERIQLAAGQDKCGGDQAKTAACGAGKCGTGKCGDAAKAVPEKSQRAKKLGQNKEKTNTTDKARTSACGTGKCGTGKCGAATTPAAPK